MDTNEVSGLAIYSQVGQIIFQRTALGIMGPSIILYGFDCLLWVDHPLKIYRPLYGSVLVVIYNNIEKEEVHNIVGQCIWIWTGRGLI